MDWFEDFQLIKIEDIKKTQTIFHGNWEKMDIEEVKFYITEDGTGILHELIELDFVRFALKTENKISDYSWEHSKALFHFLTDWILASRIEGNDESEK